MIATNLFEYGEFFEIPFDKVDGLKAYLQTVWESRPQYSEENQNAQRFIQFDGNKIRARNYSGFIQYEDLHFNIYPKVCKSNKKEGNILNHVLHWLSHSERIRFPIVSNEIGLQNTDDWFEALIAIFAKVTNDVLESNPYQSYQEVIEETQYLRGRLAINEYISQNLVKGNWTSFRCTHEPFIFDNLFNRIVKSVTKSLASKTKRPETYVILDEILFLLDEVTDYFYNAEDCDKVKLNPLYQELAKVLDLCKMFLEMQTISETNAQNSNFCLMLPMETIFEDYVFALIKKHLPRERPLGQKGNFLAITDKETHTFLMKPDILLQKSKIVVDTKYKLRDRALNNKKGISELDLYQMITYCTYHQYDKAILIYPSDGPESIDEFSINNSSIKVTAIDFYIFDNNNLKVINEISLG
ncbi:McrC family protein [Lacihabitans lacunae]|uniref:McrC family protein n=1 Tax=Lacihabitans lacunae TaxID=1028214 RepID=A0ABV7YSF0_9BACT